MPAIYSFRFAVNMREKYPAPAVTPLSKHQISIAFQDVARAKLRHLPNSAYVSPETTNATDGTAFLMPDMENVLRSDKTDLRIS